MSLRPTASILARDIKYGNKTHESELKTCQVLDVRSLSVRCAGPASQFDVKEDCLSSKMCVLDKIQ